MGPDTQSLTITIDTARRVSALFTRPASALASLVLAHGAGAGMEHASMTALATGLSERGIATLRYQFPYMERGSRRPDGPALCHATVRAAVGEAFRLAPELPLFAGGRSFGGRMTSQAQAISPLPGVLGLAFAAFPLHPAGKPSTERAQHLLSVTVPMLFLQGTRDALADRQLLEQLIGRLGNRATLYLLEDADHSFRIPAGSGRSQAQVQTSLLDELSAWIKGLATGS